MTSVGGIGNPAPAARRCPGAVGTCRSGKSQWAVAPTAPCRGTALSTGQGRYVPPPRHLHQDSVALTQSAPGGRECNSGQTSRSGSRIAGQGLIAVGKRGDLGCVSTNDVPRSDQIVRPSRVDEYLRFRRTGEPTDHDGAPGDVATQDGNFAGMWIRRPRLGQVVVAVVPDDDKTGLGRRRKNCTARADDDPGGPAQCSEPPSVSHGRPQACGQTHHCIRSGEFGTCGDDAVQVALIGHNQNRGFTTCRYSPGQFGQAQWPVFTRQRLPDRTRAFRLANRGQEGVTESIEMPTIFDRFRSGRRLGGLPRFRLDLRVARRYRQTENVSTGSGITLRHTIDDLRDFGRQDPLGRDDAFEPAELPLMVTGRLARDDETVHQTTSEADAHPDSGLRIRFEFTRNEVVEFTVEVSEREHRQHPGDRIDFCRYSFRAHPRPVCTSVIRDQLRYAACRHDRYSPTGGRCRCDRSDRMPPSARRSDAAGRGRG